MVVFNVLMDGFQASILSFLVIGMISFTRQRRLYYGILLIVFFLEAVVMRCIQLSASYHGFIYFLTILLFSKKYSNTKWQDSMIPAIIVLTLVTLIHIIPTYFEYINCGYNELQIRIISNVFSSVVLLILGLIIGCLLSRVVVKKVQYFDIFFWLFVFLEILLICLKNSLSSVSVNMNFIVIGIVLLLLVDCLIIYLYYRIHIDYLVNYNKTQCSEVLDGYRKCFEPIKKVNNEIKMIRHDLKNSMSIVTSYIKRNKIGEALAYLERNYEVFDKMDYLVATEMTVIDLVVNMKKHQASLQNISTTIDIQLKEPPNISDLELSCLLGNALDNAIEHIGEAKKIHLEIIGNELMTKIVITNSVDKPILIENPRLKSTKCGENHGIGIMSMKQTVKKNKGMIEFRETEGFFVCTIILIN